MATFFFKYRIESPGAAAFEYELELDQKTLNLIPKTLPKGEKKPHWCALSFKKCPHCPLKKDEYCPIAYNMHDLLVKFKSSTSIKTCVLTVETPERAYHKETDIQRALGSLFGLIMATSACPSMNFLKPMARFHLPCATLEETMFRSFGSFLIGEYLLGNTDKEALNEKLGNLYATVNVVNQHMLLRLESLMKSAKSGAGDADLNAIVILDTMASVLSIQLEDNISLISGMYGESS